VIGLEFRAEIGDIGLERVDPTPDQGEQGLEGVARLVPFGCVRDLESREVDNCVGVCLEVGLFGHPSPLYGT
jgi:hypothetical protein